MVLGRNGLPGDWGLELQGLLSYSSLVHLLLMAGVALLHTVGSGCLLSHGSVSCLPRTELAPGR